MKAPLLAPLLISHFLLHPSSFAGDGFRSLFNSMNKEEVRNLIAYVLSAGDQNHAMFKR
jgi:hypothetical protein